MTQKTDSFTPLPRTSADASLEEFFEKYNTLAIADVDTRALVSYIRDHGAMNELEIRKTHSGSVSKSQSFGKRKGS